MTQKVIYFLITLAITGCSVQSSITSENLLFRRVFLESDEKLRIDYFNGESGCLKESYKLTSTNGYVSFTWHENLIYFDEKVSANCLTNIDSIIRTSFKTPPAGEPLTYPNYRADFLVDKKGSVLVKGIGFDPVECGKPLGTDVYRDRFLSLIKELNPQFSPAMINGSPVNSIYSFEFDLYGNIKP